jgi:DNA-binding protein HU-beta
MATLEKPTLRMRPHDEAIFVASDSRRARRLGRAAAVTAFLAVLWVVGLGIGMVGFGHMPGVPFVKGERAESPVAPATDVPAAAARDVARALAEVTSVRAVVRSTARRGNTEAASAIPAKRRAPAKKAAVRAARPVAPPTAAVNPAQRTRGWARKGNEAPPGQARRAVAQPPAPPATSNGRRVGQTATSPKPVVPPGQAKKALEPPPPPPPPTKKG